MSKRDYSPHYRQVMAKVKKRDSNKCQFPQCNKKNIQVHHIMKHAHFPLLRNSEKNLICLCNKHHKQVTKKEEIYGPLLSKIVSEKYQ